MKKKIKVFLSENFEFLEVKFSVYLNRRVFEMITALSAEVFQNFLEHL